MSTKKINKNDTVTRNEFSESGVVETHVKASRVIADSRSDKSALAETKKLIRSENASFTESVKSAKVENTQKMRAARDTANEKFKEESKFFASDDYAVGVRKHIALARIVHEFDSTLAAIKGSAKLTGRSLKDTPTEKSVVDVAEYKKVRDEFQRQNGFSGASGKSKYSQFVRIGKVADSLDTVAGRLPSGWAFLSELVATVYPKNAEPVSLQEFLDYSLSEYAYTEEEQQNRPTTLDGSHLKGRKVLWTLKVTPQSTLAELRLLRRYFFGDASVGIPRRAVEYIRPTTKKSEPAVAAVSVRGGTVDVPLFQEWVAKQRVDSHEKLLEVLRAQVKKTLPFLDIDIPEMNATLSATVDAWFERASKAA